jgi:Icc-related predicted phosphoesterase
MIKKFLTVITTILLFNLTLFAQQTNPINSNYLIEHGVSPRILDAAASSFMQDGSFTENIVIKLNKADGEKKYELELIYDPNYESGMDIRLVNKSDKLNKDEKKKITKFIEKSHYFSRMSRDYLYDESTLKPVKTNGDTLVLEFFYQKKDIDPYLKVVKKLKGNIYFVKGNLDKVVLTNVEPLSGDIIKYKKVVRYSKPNIGGYIVNSSKEILQTEDGMEVEIISVTSDYADDKGVSLAWKNMPTKETQTTGIQ